jgi:hypothetical protein
MSNTCCPTIIVDNFCAIKDPDEVLDYTINWNAVLSASTPEDFVVLSTWSVRQYQAGADLNIDSDSEINGYNTVWLSGGGKLNTIHKVTNHVTTAGGRQYERSIKIWIQNKGGLGGYGGMSVGIPGLDGIDGVNGADGAKGDKGNTGATGATGSAGTSGSDGSDGSDGTVNPLITRGAETLSLSGVTTAGYVTWMLIGIRVSLCGRLTINSNGSSSSPAFITGLTHVCGSATGFVAAYNGVVLEGVPSERSLVVRIATGQNLLTLHTIGSTGSELPMKQSRFTDGDYIDINFSYDITP